jgi:hypothetical protein
MEDVTARLGGMVIVPPICVVFQQQWAKSGPSLKEALAIEGEASDPLVAPTNVGTFMQSRKRVCGLFPEQRRFRQRDRRGSAP